MKQLLPISLFVLTLVGAASLHAQEPATPLPARYDFWPAVRQARESVANARKPEALEMLVGIISGSQLGPGEGWFHPSESRYNWARLVKEYDADGDGQLTFDELPRRKALVRRLDRNRDETLKADDFDWTDRAAFAREAGVSGMWFRQADGNSNGKLSQTEWVALFQAIAKGKDFLTPADLREAFPITPPTRRPVAGGAAPSGPSTWTLLAGLASGEIGCLTEGPGLNQAAPNFTLKTQDGKRSIELAEFRDKKPVVLIFGSFT